MPEAAEARAGHPLAALDADVLVVEDDIETARAMNRGLQEMGCRVAVAHSGQAGWDLYRKQPFDVLITDLRMPSGDGEHLAKIVRSDAPFLPIIIVTGHLGATERLADELGTGPCLVLKKPVSLDRLGQAILSLLGA